MSYSEVTAELEEIIGPELSSELDGLARQLAVSKETLLRHAILDLLDSMQP